MESLELLQAVLPGTAALVQGTAGHLFAADHTRINVLDTALRLRSTIPFDQAFLGHSQPLEALACDRATNRIAAVSGARVGVWEAGPAESWRLHSSFLVNHLVTSIDFAQGTIAAGGDAVSVWTLDDTHGTPVWRQIALEARATAVLEVKLSPFADILASVSVASNIVRLSQINQPSSGSTFSALKFLAQASHSQRVRSIGWRPDKCSTDSGPILHTTTIDGRFRIWGCMIDEPDFFSLWATLDVHAESDGSVPISTNFHRTTSMWEAKEGESGARMGTKDDFVTVFSNGSLYSTTVVNLDCRPPTCLSQSSRLLPSQPFSKDQLPNLRHTVLVAEDDGSTLLARCSRGTLIRARLPDALPLAGPAPPPVAIAVNSTGTIQRIVPSHGGGSFVLLGAQGTIQGWRLEEQGVQPSFVAESACPLGSKLASWDNGRMMAIVSSSAIEVLEVQVNGRVKLLATLPFDSPSTSTINTLVVAKASSEDTTLVATTSDHVALIWTISSNPFVISEQAILEHTTSICLTTTVPPRSVSTASESATVLSIEEDGTLSFWTIALPLEANSEWKLGTSVHTGRQSPVLAACSSESMTAVVAKSLDSNELSIWDSKESEYASGLQFSLVISGDLNHVRWSDDSGTLAVASATEVKLLCSQLLDDLSGAPSWITYATVSVDHLTTSPISTLSWLSTGALAIASNELLFLHSPLLTSGINCHQFTAERSAPLPYHHPQLLFQCLLHGKLHVVVKILVGLAGQLTETGELTPIEIKSTEIETITMDDFLTGVDGPVKATGPDSDIFLALTNAASRQSNGIKSLLTDEDTQRLLAAIHKCTLRGLSKLEHAHLALLVQTVFEVQTQQNSLDANGLRYLISMRSYFIYSTAILPASPTLGPSRQPTSRLKYRDMVWAFHSESQDVLLEASIKACPGKLTWENAKALGLFMWLRSPEVIASQMEAVGRCEYTKDPEEKNPIAASLFYLALKKKHMVITLWRQAGGHSDQRSMLKLLVNDFDEPRWKSAALKNAYALMSKRRFHFAAAFFLLGGSLKDAVNVCVRQIDDFQLAIALARAHEGDSGPVLRTILEEHVIPFAFKVGFRWLASWSFWMLNRKDLAIQTIITPLASLASTLPYKLVSIGSPIHEDPCLVLLFGQLRSWSLQTVKGAIAVSGQTEFNFVLHMCRVLCRMGCHVLAFDLVREWEFVRPEPPPSRVARLPSLRPGHSLRRLSTKLDLEISSNLPSRAPSPDRESGAAAFHEVLKKVKKETAAPAEFSFDSFAF